MAWPVTLPEYLLLKVALWLQSELVVRGVSSNHVYKIRESCRKRKRDFVGKLVYTSFANSCFLKNSRLAHVLLKSALIILNCIEVHVDIGVSFCKTVLVHSPVSWLNEMDCADTATRLKIFFVMITIFQVAA
jgi:hypothetical protein